MGNKQLAEGDPAEKLVIFGTSSFGELAYYFFTSDSSYQVVGFTADREYIDDDEKFGLPVIPFEELAEEFPPREYSLFIAIAYRDVNKIRAEKYQQAKDKGYSLATFVHSSATVADNVTIGENTFIFEDQTIQPFVEIGDNVVLWSGNHIGHHSTINDHSFVTSHVVVSGHCLVDEYSFLGVNATIADGLTIEKRTVIGAGATIVEDTQPGGVYTGQAAQLRSSDSSQSEI
jgi:sugar O-acyltransferase (sialic acid O-acetyltransferase NeuD family)